MGNYYEDVIGEQPEVPQPKRRARRVVAIVLAAAIVLGVAGGIWQAASQRLGSCIDVITVSGTISSATQSGLFDSVGYDHQFLLNSIDNLMYDDSNEAILLVVDSPGGGVYESDELYLKLREYKETTGRPIYASFAATAASGGYYIAMAADRIYANRNCMTGSIGVIMGTYLDMTGLMDKLGIKTANITSGRNKAMGSSYEEMTAEQRGILQSYVDEAYDQFVGIVAEGRPNLDEARIRELADGRIYSARQAADNGLIDEVGAFDDALAGLQQDCGLEWCDVRYVEKGAASVWQTLFSAARELRPKNEIESAVELYQDAITKTGYYCHIPA